MFIFANITILEYMYEWIFTRPIYIYICIYIFATYRNAGLRVPCQEHQEHARDQPSPGPYSQKSKYHLYEWVCIYLFMSVFIPLYIRLLTGLCECICMCVYFTDEKDDDARHVKVYFWSPGATQSSARRQRCIFNTKCIYIFLIWNVQYQQILCHLKYILFIWHIKVYHAVENV